MANEAKIKFTADIKDVELKMQKIKSDILKAQMGQVYSGVRKTDLQAKLAGAKYEKQNVKINAAEGLYGDLSEKAGKGGRGTTGRGMLMAAGIGLAGASMLLNIEERMTSRRNAFSTATLTNINQANAGLMTGAAYEQRQMEATRKNLMGMYGNIPILSGYMQRKLDQDKGYQNYMIDLERQQNIQSDASSATMSAWNNARSMGFKMSDQELERLGKLNLNIATQRQDAQQKVNALMQGTQESKKLERERMAYAEKYGDVGQQLREVWKEFLDDLKSTVMNFLPSIRSAGGG